MVEKLPVSLEEAQAIVIADFRAKGYKNIEILRAKFKEERSFAEDLVLPAAWHFDVNLAKSGDRESVVVAEVQADSKQCIIRGRK